MSRKSSIFRIVLIVAVALAGFAPASPVSAGTNVWTSSGPGGGSIFTLAIDPASPTTLYAGTLYTGVFKSTNGGGAWNAANTGLIANAVLTLAIDSVVAATLYAGTNDGGGVQSTD